MHHLHGMQCTETARLPLALTTSINSRHEAEDLGRSSGQADGVNLLTLAALEQATSAAPLCAGALVLRSELRTDRNGHPYAAITLRLADTAILDARWWRFPSATRDCPIEGAVYRFTGFGESFNGTRQMRIVDAESVPDADLTPFVAAVRRSLGDLVAELDRVIGQIDDDLAAIVRSVLFGETYERFCTWPAAQRRHGALRHGLLAHSLQVVELALRLADGYGAQRLPCDRSLVVAGALLHDVGKVHTLPPIAGATLPDEAALLDHTTRGMLMVQQAATSGEVALEPSRLEALLHIVVAHHGRAEWGAVVEPQTVEAWLVHVADQAEARLWHYSEDACAA